MPEQQQQTQQTQQQQAPAWHASLPEDLRGNANITKYTSIEDLARGHVAASSFIGKDPNNFIEVPKDDAGRLGALRRLGASDKPEAYKIAAPADAPEHVKTLPGILSKVAAETGLLPAQAQKVFDAVREHLGGVDKASSDKRNATHATNIEALKKEWGAAFDDHVKLANSGLGRIETAAKLGDGGAARLAKKIEEAGLGTDPDVMKVLALIGDMTQEDGSLPARGGAAGAGGGKFGSGTPSAHEEKAQEYQRQAMREKDPAERKRLNGLATKEWEAAAKSANG